MILSSPISVRRTRSLLKTRRFTPGVAYYAYRYYDPLTGSWPSRDLIGERGGLNVYVMCFNNTLIWLDYLGQEPRTINILPRTDSSIPKGNEKIQKDLDKKFEVQMQALNGYLDCCCLKYKIACDVDADSELVSQPTPQAPADGGYRRNDSRTEKSLGKADGNNIPLTFTDANMTGGDVGGMAGTGTGVLMRRGNAPALPPYTLAHELGHVADYNGNSLTRPPHDEDHTPGEQDSSKDSIMAPEGGDIPTKQWCTKVGGLAK